MADVILAAEVGRTLGSRATRRLRREGKIPGVIYGHGTDPVDHLFDGSAHLPIPVARRERRRPCDGGSLLG